VWQALVDGDVTRGYYFGCRVESAWTPGSRYRLVDAAGATLVAGENLEVDPPHRLVQTFDILGGPGRQRMGARVPRPSSGRSSGWAMWARRVS